MKFPRIVEGASRVSLSLCRVVFALPFPSAGAEDNLERYGLGAVGASNGEREGARSDPVIGEFKDSCASGGNIWSRTAVREGKRGMSITSEEVWRHAAC